MTATESLGRCGLGIRATAAVVDSFVRMALFFLVGVVAGAATDQPVVTATRVETDVSGAASLVGLLVWLALSLAY